ncbi:hypothetical protein [Endozoicomonas sp. ONNA2]|uniref:hypothetical protein n=1 Tax=Endozoicomonas sp. ONNA2 TaxID=2828741 RepID=UPI002147E8BD|nr:hypothetical protein [Endozoicomonas sp. ONNA2]
MLANHFDPFAQPWLHRKPGNNSNQPNSTLIRLAERNRRVDLVNLLKNYTPVPYQPTSLQCGARASIRARLVQNRANLAQALSADSHCLGLPTALNTFVYRPLSL